MSKAKLNGESRVAEYLSRMGLRIERFSKAEMRKGRTPDFRVFAREKLAFYCEVKTAQDDEWLDGERPDPTYNRSATRFIALLGSSMR